MDIGIDIGTGSVRSYSTNFTKTYDISTTKHSPHVITQSSQQIYNAILKVLPENTKTIKSICFMATCSMVVKQKVVIDGKSYLKPFNCGFGSKDQDIILWMDSRSHDQCTELNKKLYGTFMKNTIGNFIPELGLPKLKWLSDNVTCELYCFELYDWFNYVFQVGYTDDAVEFKLTDFEYICGNGIDGSIKGWTANDLKFISNSIKVGKGESVTQTPEKLPPLGAFIGDVSQTILNGCKIYNGGIDCYGGWVSTVTDLPGAVSMIAGTSTCFVYESTSTSEEKDRHIDGVWGPFELVQGKSVYSFGQPATGKLFEELFQEYGMDPSSSSFNKLEQLTHNLEQTFNMSVTQLIKNYHYYGDKYGNRSPLMNFNMNQMVIDGKNSSPLSVSIFSNDEKDKETALIIKYHLILEFLTFQTHQLLKPLPIQSLIISGSQTHNVRFLSMLEAVIEKPVYVLEGDHSLNVAKGAMKLCGTTDLEPYKRVITITDDKDGNILRKKAGFIYDMVQLQQRFYGQLQQE